MADSTSTLIKHFYTLKATLKALKSGESFPWEITYDEKLRPHITKKIDNNLEKYYRWKMKNKNRGFP